MNWIALVPFKAMPRKSRLAQRLSLAARERLTQVLFDRLMQTLRAVPEVGAVYVIADEQPQGRQVGWIRDLGRGLNAEIEAARAELDANTSILVIHADLPLVEPTDIRELLTRGEQQGCAIAADRHGDGTNAIALARGRAFNFHFGPHSLPAHLAQASPAALVECRRLSLDCDTPDDLDAAIAAGFELPGGD